MTIHIDTIIIMKSMYLCNFDHSGLWVLLMGYTLKKAKKMYFIIVVGT